MAAILPWSQCVIAYLHENESKSYYSRVTDLAALYQCVINLTEKAVGSDIYIPAIFINPLSPKPRMCL